MNNNKKKKYIKKVCTQLRNSSFRMKMDISVINFNPELDWDHQNHMTQRWNKTENK